ncbi:MAG TPA: hypothetical protein PLW35_06005 [Verrucomicrobiota bacterium]|nr:hypothetical protein [Verrucomicrobiota bacterium]
MKTFNVLKRLWGRAFGPRVLVQEHRRSGTQSWAFMAETINYAAMHNGVVLVGHRSANGAVHTSVGRSPTKEPSRHHFSQSKG